MPVPMRILTGAIAAGVFALASVPAAAAPMSVRALAAQEAKLATIAYRIGTANADLCRTRGVMTGLVVHDLTKYHPAVRPAISAAFALKSGIGVLAIVDGSAAAEAGLQVDDEILRIGEESVEEPAAFQARSKSFARIDRFHAVLDRRLATGPAPILVRRQGQVRQLELRGTPGCAGVVALDNSTALDAWSDGSHIVVTLGMQRFARSDDEVAFVVAHEIAHNLLGHSDRVGSRTGILGSILKSRRWEIEADSLAVRVMSRAGYRPEGGRSLLQTLGRRLWRAMSLDHPGFSRRMQVVTQTIAALPRTGAPAVSVERTLADRRRLPPEQSVAQSSISTWSGDARALGGTRHAGFKLASLDSDRSSFAP